MSKSINFKLIFGLLIIGLFFFGVFSYVLAKECSDYDVQDCPIGPDCKWDGPNGCVAKSISLLDVDRVAAPAVLSAAQLNIIVNKTQDLVNDLNTKPAGLVLRSGDVNLFVSKVKQAMFWLGLWKADDVTNVYNKEFPSAVGVMQTMFGIPSDENLGDVTNKNLRAVVDHVHDAFRDIPDDVVVIGFYAYYSRLDMDYGWMKFNGNVFRPWNTRTGSFLDWSAWMQRVQSGGAARGVTGGGRQTGGAVPAGPPPTGTQQSQCQAAEAALREAWGSYQNGLLSLQDLRLVIEVNIDFSTCAVCGTEIDNLNDAIININDIPVAVPSLLQCFDVSPPQ